jgi:predicted component of type VI protein secretion system
MPQAFALCCKAAGALRIRARHRTTGAEQTHTVGSPYAFLGRSPACGVRLDDPSVSQAHAYLQIIEGAPYCIDLGSRAGVVWDDGTTGRGWISPDQAVRIGAFDVWVEGALPPPPATPLGVGSDHDTFDESALPTAFVEVHGTNRLHPLDKPITLVGRHPTCDLRLLEQPLAYFQCALVNTHDGMWLVDMLTPKGAVLNGRATRLARVRDGDLIEVGKYSLLMRVGSHHASRAALATVPAVEPVTDPFALVSARMAESMAGAFLPVGEMMKQFQQCFMTMAQMLMNMQQEHAGLVSEQMRTLHDMVSELRELRAEVRRGNAALPPHAPHEPRPAPPPSQPAPQPSPSRNPSLKPPSGVEGQALADAHAWFMERLMGKSQAPPAGS